MHDSSNESSKEKRSSWFKTAGPIFKDVKTGFQCIGLKIGLGHILCVFSFLDIDMMTNLSIGIWNWIGVYLRPCLSSKVPKQGCPCIGLEIGFGHILRVISFIDIDMMAGLSIGLGYI